MAAPKKTPPKKTTGRRTTARKTGNSLVVEIDEAPGLLHKLAIGGVKVGGSFSAGATMGAAEEYFGESTGTIIRGASTLVGFVGDIYADPIEQPLLSEVSKAAMYGGSHVEGYKWGKKKMGETLAKRRQEEDDARRVREGQRTESLIAELKSSMEATNGEGEHDATLPSPSPHTNGRAHDNQQQ